MSVPIRALAIALLLAIAPPVAIAPPAAAKPLIDTANDTGTFTVLMAAIKQADLTEMLSGPGPYTLFAPSDDAFAKLPKDDYQALFRPENKQKLRKILTYHLVAGTVRARDVNGRRMEAETVEGDPLLIDATRTMMVNDARIVQSDIKADNGIIHVIDTVLMPK